MRRSSLVRSGRALVEVPKKHQQTDAAKHQDDEARDDGKRQQGQEGKHQAAFAHHRSRRNPAQVERGCTTMVNAAPFQRGDHDRRSTNAAHG